MVDDDFSVIEILGEKIQNIEDFHKQIEEILNISPYYGRNINALEDVLCSFWQTTLVWHNSDLSKNRLGQDFHDVITVFDRIRKSHTDNGLSGAFTYILK